ncbi:hypothetical protein ACF1BP_18940 [Streptomyces sp. NPDC014735]|uniref:hypothetical protein n=1 Tax=unclassified Streptomyces TaxID=2593676 RepID=UPI00093B75DF|nr:hypothetical protein [Streptomyces sp. CB01580]OKJ45165.1 hypothetical protein AMK22_00030 [Streptomyces sp. CB01580]
MALMKISGTELVVEFSGREQTWLRRGTLSVPLAAVRRVVPVDNPLREAHGARKGLQVSGVAKIGTWGLMLGPRQLVAAYRGKPGLRVQLDRAASGEQYDELVLSLDDAGELARLIGRHQEQN